jgi:hypothetical protein
MANLFGGAPGDGRDPFVVAQQNQVAYDNAVAAYAAKPDTTTYDAAVAAGTVIDKSKDVVENELDAALKAAQAKQPGSPMNVGHQGGGYRRRRKSRGSRKSRKARKSRKNCRN